ncbi:hypothetical protein BS78_03G146500 [Paspalum vaginatum]|nr:hypothetical protein BS78_03G146500 [Paspalum vaginatum]
MGRRKVSMGLIPGRAARISRFAKRKAGLKKKAEELSILCGVDVALVVAAPDGDGDGSPSAAAADVWESRAGVLARYRALSPEVRARHTHRAYLDAELGKEEAKLARLRQAGPAGLDRWDKALDAGVATADEARKLLGALDAAIRAADDRRAALGMPPMDGDDGGCGAGVALEGVAPLGLDLLHAPGDRATAMRGATNGLDTQMQMHPGGGGGYGFQQCSCGNCCAGMDASRLQMAPDMYGGASSSSSSSHQPRDAAAGTTMQHGYGFQGARASYFGAPSAGYGQMPPQPNPLAMWSTTDQPRHAIVPVDYYPSAEPGLNYMAAPEAYGAQGGGGMSFTAGSFINNAPPPALSLATGTGNFISNAPPAAAGPSYTMMGSTGDNFTNPTPAQPLAMMSYGGDLTSTDAGRYATPQWQAAQQPQRAGSRQQSSFEQLHYLSDLEETQLNLWEN